MSAEKSGPHKAASPTPDAQSTANGEINTVGTAVGSVEEGRALNIACKLIDAGIPVFAAPPIPGKPGEYQLPSHWEKTVPSVVNLERWQPGWALAAVGGHAADFLDVDPRNGGNESLADIVATGHMPRSFGQQETPSGGTHDIISATGERKSTNFLPGLDLQSGSPDGVGRGFVWIAPTVRKSKNPDDNGALRAYRWVTKPDVDGLHEYAGCDDSTTGIVTRVQAKRSAPRQRQPITTSPDDPFMTPGDLFRANGGAGNGERSFTQQQAQDFVRPHLMNLRGAQNGEINNQLNATALTVAHFVPTFWSEDQAMALLADALADTAYDGKTWQAEDTIQSAFRKADTDWKATRRAETAGTAATATAAVAPNADRLAIMRAKLLTPVQLENQPEPKPLVRGLLFMDSLAWIIGEPGSFKSFVALDIACHVAAGLPWQGKEVTQGKVLYIAAEGATGLKRRLKAWRKKHGVTPELLIMPCAIQAASAEEWATLVALCQEIDPVLIVLDTQARVTVGMEENSATDMGTFIQRLDELKQATTACVKTVHHTGRNGGDARGSSAIDGAQDTELKVIRASPRSTLKAKIRVEKQKDGEDGWDVDIELERVALGVDPETEDELSSLVLMPHDLFRNAQDSGQREPDWKRDLAGVSLEIMQVMKEHSGSNGATLTEIDRWVNERRKQDNPSARTLPASTRSTAIKSLCGEDGKAGEPRLLRDGKTRVILPEFAESND